MNRATQSQNRILTIPKKAANAALALAILLGLAISLSPSAQAQLYTETVMHSFAGPPDGALPNAAFVGDGLGNLYGTTVEGGTFNYGAVFELDANGNETVLYSFPGPAGPQAGLIRDSQGNLYGTTGGEVLSIGVRYSRWMPTGTRQCCTASLELEPTAQLLTRV